MTPVWRDKNPCSVTGRGEGIHGIDLADPLVTRCSGSGELCVYPAVAITRPRVGRLVAGAHAAADREASGFDVPETARAPRLGADPPPRVRASEAWQRLRDGGTAVAWLVGSGAGSPLRATRGARLSSADVLAAVAGDSGASALAVAVPDDLDERAQTQLLYALRRDGRSAWLVWRPAAAALGALARGPLGVDSMVCLDLGGPWPACTELRLRNHEGQTIPVRSRPLPLAPAPFSASLLADQLAPELLRAASLPTSPATLWHATHGRCWIADALWSAVQGLPASFVVPIGEEGSQCVADLRVEPTAIDCSVDRLFAERQSAPLSTYEWIEEQAKTWQAEVACDPRRSTLVSFGWPATLPRVAARIRAIAAGVAPDLDTTWQDRGLLAERAALVARGAALYGARRYAGLPTYLDTLPHLALRIRRGWKVAYRDLTPPGQVVAAAEVYKGAIEDLCAQRGAQRLRFRVQRDDELLPREAVFELPARPDQDVPLRLFVHVRPAAGHAQVWAEPADGSLALGSRQVGVRWDDMAATDIAADSAAPLAWLPPLQTEGGSHEQLQRIAEGLERLAAATGRRLAHELGELRRLVGEFPGRVPSTGLPAVLLRERVQEGLSKLARAAEALPPARFASTILRRMYVSAPESYQVALVAQLEQATVGEASSADLMTAACCVSSCALLRRLLRAFGAWFQAGLRSLRLSAGLPAPATPSANREWNWVHSLTPRSIAALELLPLKDWFWCVARIMRFRDEAPLCMSLSAAWGMAEAATALLVATAGQGTGFLRETRREALRMILFLLRLREVEDADETCFLEPGTTEHRVLTEALDRTEPLSGREGAGRTLNELVRELLDAQFPEADLPALRRDFARVG